MSEPDWDLIAKLVGQLGSANDQEVLAASRLIRKLVSFGTLAERIRTWRVNQPVYSVSMPWKMHTRMERERMKAERRRQPTAKLAPPKPQRAAVKA